MSSNHFAGVNGVARLYLIASVTLTVALGVAAGRASAQDSVWIGGSGFIWNTTANWQSGLVPNASRNAIIPMAPAAGQIPEPGTLALLSLAIAVMAVARADYRAEHELR
ncbi:MAG: PEP-CTERM sorting domain-containing protein [Pirellulales bacterium]|nr:PEP-CTERM sorting domain-containing protein [Pirellulales bacterium]